MTSTLAQRLLLKRPDLGTAYLRTWSPLANTFNTRPTPKLNFSLSKENVGLFNIPELTSHEGFYILRDKCKNATEELIEEATGIDRKRKMVEIFDDLSNSLCKVADLAEFIRLAHSSVNYAKAAESACCAISGLVERLNTDVNLYNSLRDVVHKGDIINTNDIDNHVAKLFLFDFEQSGIHLSENDRNKIVSLTDYILQLGQQFVAGTTSPRTIKLALVPDFVKNVFVCDGENITVSGLHGDSTNPLIRELAYRIYLQPESRQEQLLQKLLQARNALAVTCGFETYSYKTLNGSLMQNPSAVMEFLTKLSNNIKDKAELDFYVMNVMKQNEHSDIGKLAPWDVPYYTQKIKREKFKVTSSEYSPYFSLGVCMEGLSNIFSSLYGITLQDVPLKPGEAWVNDVYKLAVTHESEGLLGYIYCDFYERKGKPNQDCHFTIQGGKYLPTGEYQLPIVVLMLTLPMPKWSSPCLLTPSMLDNLFHEMGHAMHSMLGRTHYQHVTGTRCSTDFAEVPSVLMEYFAADPRVLRTFAKHFQTKETIPDEMLHRLCGSKHLFMASETQLQIFYSALDQKYHAGPLKGSTMDVIGEMQNQYYGLPYIPNTAWQLRFSHLFGYGAKYYSYLVSKALASWIWQTYFEKDPFNRSHGERYRRECLGHGGGKPPWNMVADFLKKDPTPSLLAESLIHEIDCKNEELRYVKDIYNQIK
ncbi:Peptidase family M3 [Popillia japonica]|uniref:Peptidase family M3 n=1 Tax=Popillia japonica TaxID=7064 RepID=A0AAW1L5C4_POPJA